MKHTVMVNAGSKGALPKTRVKRFEDQVNETFIY